MASSCSRQLPICNGTYTNDSEVPADGFLNQVKQFFNGYIQGYRTFFTGLCHYCYAAGCISDSRVHPLQRCSGCQLISYCSRSCQKDDWYSHKYVCKEFPLVNGKNVLYTKGSWKKHITVLREQASNLPDTVVSGVKPIFDNPRVCSTCWESRPDKLSDCKCLCVSYCSKRCAKADKRHKEDCQELSHISQIYSTYQMVPVEDLPCRKAETLCEKYTPVINWTDMFPPTVIECYITYLKYRITVEHLSYPMSLLYALQTLPERRLSQNYLPLEALTTLDVHVVSSSPLLDSEPWEAFMHRLPKLKQLNIVFVVQGKSFKQSFNFNNLANLSLRRCNDCEGKDRVISYTVKQMHYHMYFSLQEYTVPDVVVVYGNTYEMAARKDEVDIHSEISYRNMTYSSHTVLVLMDTTLELVRQGVRAVNTARPVDQLVAPQINNLRGYRCNRAQLDSKVAVSNDKHYFTCLKKL